MSQTGTARNVDKRMVYSRFWPVKTLRTEDTIQSTGLAFSGDGECILTAIYWEEAHEGYIKVSRSLLGRKLMIVGGVQPEDWQADGALGRHWIIIHGHSNLRGQQSRANQCRTRTRLQDLDSGRRGPAAETDLHRRALFGLPEAL